MDIVKKLAWGVPVGLINGFFGSGGGIAALYVLKKFLKTEQKKAHATAISVILPLSAAGGFMYARSLESNLPLILKCSAGGILGGVIGAKLLGKISKKHLGVIFGSVMIISGIKMILG
jgi:hypothetical protein